MQGQVGGQQRDRSEQLGFTSQGCPTRPTGSPATSSWSALLPKCSLLRTTTPTSKNKLKLKIKGRDIKALPPEKGHPAHRQPLQRRTDTTGWAQVLLLLFQDAGQRGGHRGKRPREAGSLCPAWLPGLRCGADLPLQRGLPLQPSLHPQQHGPRGPTASLPRERRPALRRHASSGGSGASPRRRRSGHRWHSRRRRPGCGSCGG